MRPRPAALLLGALVLISLTGDANASASDLRVDARTQLTPRLRELAMTTPALDFPPRVRILVADGYDSPRTRRSPVLYLLHGSLDTSAGWSERGAAEQLTAGLPLIVV